MLLMDAKHRLVQSMPLSTVDPRSTKPNKHFPLIFHVLDDLRRRWAPGCNRIQEFCDRLCVYNGLCTDWILVPLVTITTMCNAVPVEYQSKYNLQLLYKFHGRIDYWKCVYVTFDLFIVFLHISRQIYDIQI